ncbi:MAG TPA: sigma-70 family RNA polymerase sigma factor [Rhodanobacter sp.]|nr:sigma-70 family RNA polymerase sigma factor [Rhodanobacter sp.]
MTDTVPTDVASLARSYGRQVFHAAWRVLGDTAQAEDVQQEVFLRLLEKSPEKVISWPAWLTTLATRMAIDRLRRHQRWRRLIPIWHAGEAPAFDSTEHDAIRADWARQLRHALCRLKPKEAECFTLRHLQGMEIAAIAKATDMTVNHVSVCLHRAARTLEVQLADIENMTSPEVL